MEAQDALRPLEALFDSLADTDAAFTDLYNRVQHCGAVLPRLYLMCMVGGIYLRRRGGAAKEVLTDMVEMCKGVQQPTRGLFLRSYLHQVTREALISATALTTSTPSSPSPSAANMASPAYLHGPTSTLPSPSPSPSSPTPSPPPPSPTSPSVTPPLAIRSALDFGMLNFVEMTKLWVRMQQLSSSYSTMAPGGQTSNVVRTERTQLEDLVGKALHTLGQLDGLTLALYQLEVLPRVLEQILACRDALAQEYLMDCLVQTFPDEFHLGTLPQWMAAVAKLEAGVSLPRLVGGLLTRLAAYASASADGRALLESSGGVAELEEACRGLLAASGHRLSPADIVGVLAAQWSFLTTLLPRDILATKFGALCQTLTTYLAPPVVLPPALVLHVLVPALEATSLAVVLAELLKVPELAPGARWTGPARHAWGMALLAHVEKVGRGDQGDRGQQGEAVKNSSIINATIALSPALTEALYRAVMVMFEEDEGEFRDVEGGDQVVRTPRDSEWGPPLPTTNHKTASSSPQPRWPGWSSTMSGSATAFRTENISLGLVSRIAAMAHVLRPTVATLHSAAVVLMACQPAGRHAAVLVGPLAHYAGQLAAADRVDDVVQHHDAVALIRKLGIYVAAPQHTAYDPAAARAAVRLLLRGAAALAPRHPAVSADLVERAILTFERHVVGQGTRRATLLETCSAVCALHEQLSRHMTTAVAVSLLSCASTHLRPADRVVGACGVLFVDPWCVASVQRALDVAMIAAEEHAQRYAEVVTYVEEEETMATSSDQLVHEDLETEVDVDSTIVSTTSSSSPSPAPAGLYVYLATAVARFLRAHPDHATVLRPMVLPLRHTLEKMDATASIREALLRLPA